MANEVERSASGADAIAPRSRQLVALVAVLAIVGIVSLLVHHIDHPRWQVRVYVFVIFGVSFVSRLRRAALHALVLLAVAGMALYAGRYHGEVRHGRMSAGVAIERVIHDLTGIGHPAE